jgi:hypothetical protein
MRSNTRFSRFACALLAASALWACSGQKEPAQKLIAAVDATVTAATPEAARYVPDQLADVQTKLGALKSSFAKKDYAGVVSGAPAVLEAAESLATAAATKKDEVLKALNDQWTALSGTVPGLVAAIQNRLEFLNKPSSKKLAAGIDLTAAKAAAGDAAALWSKAQAAFAAGNMNEAVTTAIKVKAKAEALALTLKMTPAAAPT